MKITLAMVVSVDGKTTRGDESNVNDWSSDEDQLHFQNMKNNNQVIIMGRKTYDVIKNKLKLVPNILRVVVTNDPKKFAGFAVNGKLEFTCLSPNEIVSNLASRGYQNALLVGGHQLNTSFFKMKLVSEIVLTVEPILLGKGLNLVSDNFTEIGLQLINICQLNQQGTLVCRYKII